MTRARPALLRCCGITGGDYHGSIAFLVLDKTLPVHGMVGAAIATYYQPRNLCQVAFRSWSGENNGFAPKLPGLLRSKYGEPDFERKNPDFTIPYRFEWWGLPGGSLVLWTSRDDKDWFILEWGNSKWCKQQKEARPADRRSPRERGIN